MTLVTFVHHTVSVCAGQDTHIFYPCDVLPSLDMLPVWVNPLWCTWLSDVTSMHHLADFVIVHSIAARVILMSGGRTSYGTLLITHSEICRGVLFVVVIVVVLCDSDDEDECVSILRPFPDESFFTQ